MFTQSHTRILLFIAVLLGCMAIGVEQFQAHDQFTADDKNDGSSQRGALKHFANPDISFVLDSSPATVGGISGFDLLNAALTPWNEVATSSINISISGMQDFTLADSSGLDLNGQSEIIFVDTQTFYDAAGLPEGMLGVGLSTVLDISTGVISEGLLLLVTIPDIEGDLQSTATHEFGHVFGLMHTPIGPFAALFDETIVPTMFPFALSDDALGRSLEADDVASVSEIYADPSYAATFGVITGNVIADETEPVFGAVVLAYNVTKPAILSRFSGHTSSVMGNGEFSMRVPPGRYVIGAQRLLSNRERYGFDRFDPFYARGDSLFFDAFYTTDDQQAGATYFDVAAGKVTSVTINVTRNLTSVDDIFEDNDDFTAAFDIHPGFYNLNMTAFDDDWFKIELAQGQDLIAQVRFNSEVADLDLAIFDPFGNIVAADTSTMDDAIAGILGVATPGNYWIQITSYGGLPTPYTLIVDGGAGITEVGEESVSGPVPSSLVLFQNYPNPFNPSTTIEFQIPETSNVKIRIFNSLGKEIRLLTDERRMPGRHKFTWDGRDEFGSEVTSGLYIYRIDTGQFAVNRKMILLR